MLIDYVFKYFADKEHGEWYGYLHYDNTPLDYVKGKIDIIEELEEEILVFPNSEAGKSTHYHFHHPFEEMTTVNSI